MNPRFKLTLLLLLSGIIFAPSFSSAQSGRPAAGSQAEMDDLIKAAKSEGEVLFYSGAAESGAKRIAAGFSAKYGINARFIRTAGVQTVIRFSSEAQAGAIAADFILFGGTADFAVDAVQKGWLEPIRKVNVPAITAGVFPARFIRENIAVIAVSPWGIGYNTQDISAAEAPKGWLDLLQPKYKGRILIADPRSAEAYSEFWDTMSARYGEAFLTRLRDQNMRSYSSGAPVANGLAAGEGMVAIPTVGLQIQDVAEKGAPVARIVPEYTTGAELKIALTNRAKAKHPNAGRLFVQYLMSPEGNKVLSYQGSGSLSVYEISALPKEYQSPKEDALSRKDKIANLLGYK